MAEKAMSISDCRTVDALDAEHILMTALLC